MSDFLRERVCFYSSMFRGRSCMREIIECARDFGVRGVEMMNFCQELRTPDVAAARELGTLARSYGLDLPVFSVGINIVGERGVEGMEQLRSYAEICSELEIPVLHHTIYGAIDPSRVPTPEMRAEIFDRGLEAALSVNEYAKGLGVRTIVENQGFVFNGYEWYLRFLEKAEGRIGALLDVGNIFFGGGDPCGLLDLMPTLPDHIHIKDYAFREATDDGRAIYRTPDMRGFCYEEIGRGAIDFHRFGQQLRSRGYAGLYSIEFEGVKDMDEVSRVLSFLERTLA